MQSSARLVFLLVVPFVLAGTAAHAQKVTVEYDKTVDFSRFRTYAIDPVLGRIARSDPLPPGLKLAVDVHYGFSADMGGGEYERAASFAGTEAPPRLLRVPQDHATIGDALIALEQPASCCLVHVDAAFDDLCRATGRRRRAILSVAACEREGKRE